MNPNQKFRIVHHELSNHVYQSMWAYALPSWTFRSHLNLEKERILKEEKTMGREFPSREFPLNFFFLDWSLFYLSKSCTKCNTTKIYTTTFFFTEYIHLCVFFHQTIGGWAPPSSKVMVLSIERSIPQVRWESLGDRRWHSRGLNPVQTGENRHGGKRPFSHRHLCWMHEMIKAILRICSCLSFVFE